MNLGRTKLTCGAAVRTKLKRSAECEVRTAEGEYFVAASQCSRGTAVDCSIFWCAGEGEAAVVWVPSLEEPLGVGSGEGEEGCRDEFEVGHCGNRHAFLEESPEDSKEKI